MRLPGQIAFSSQIVLFTIEEIVHQKGLCMFHAKTCSYSTILNLCTGEMYNPIHDALEKLVKNVV